MRADSAITTLLRLIVKPTVSFTAGIESHPQSIQTVCKCTSMFSVCCGRVALLIKPPF
jgi:hypothetical protein